MKKGFTLAEVLITLAIIGIVAAMTIPTLVNNYRKKDTTAKLKKFYSTMIQAIQLSELENGTSANWSKKDMAYDEEGNIDTEGQQQASDEFLDQYILPYIKYSKITDGTYVNQSRKVYFADGTTIEAKNGSCMDFYFDSNGEKSPNEWGVDMFMFLFCNSASDQKCISGITNSSVNFGAYTGCKEWSNFDTRAKALEMCKNNASTCSVLLQKYDNFEFKDDYPY